VTVDARKDELEEGSVISKVLSVVAGLCLLMAAASAAQAEPRVALVVGNSNYGSEIGIRLGAICLVLGFSGIITDAPDIS
jgi:hypothetical protein